MNYLKVYCNLIRKAETRTPPEGYTEKHHIFPKSIFGNRGRVVVLTAREHYIAHSLLERICIKRYGLKDQRTIKMITAFWCMNNQNTKNEYFNSYLYESSRMRYIDSKIGVKLTDSHRQKISEAARGKNNSMYGKNHSEETKKKISENHPDVNGKNNPMWGKKRILSQETIEKIRETNTGKRHTEETKNKLSKLISGKIWIHNKLLKEKKFINSEEIDFYLQNGWERGMGNIWMNNTVECFRVNICDYDYYTENGFIVGRICKLKKTIK
jgi:hypothetical protein